MMNELVEHALDAFIPVPPDLDEYDYKDYPHWWTFVMLNMDTGSNSEQLNHNAHIISRIPYDEVGSIHPSKIVKLLK